MCASIQVIERYTHPWPKADPKYYYVEFWKKRFPNETTFDGQDIKVYYDRDGVLHVINCGDRNLELRIKAYMDNWYRFIVEKEYEEPTAYYSVSVLIEPYVKPLKEGFFQIRYRGMVCNLSESQLSHVQSLGAYRCRKEGVEVIEVDSGIPRFDEIVSSMVLKGDIWPLRGPV